MIWLVWGGPGITPRGVRDKPKQLAAMTKKSDHPALSAGNSAPLAGEYFPEAAEMFEMNSGIHSWSATSEYGLSLSTVLLTATTLEM